MKMSILLPPMMDAELGKATAEFISGIVCGKAELDAGLQMRVAEAEITCMAELPPSRYRLLSAEITLSFPRKDRDPVSAKAYLETTDFRDGVAERTQTDFRQEVLEVANSVSEALRGQLTN